LVCHGAHSLTTSTYISSLMSSLSSWTKSYSIFPFRTHSFCNLSTLCWSNKTSGVASNDIKSTAAKIDTRSGRARHESICVLRDNPPPEHRLCSDSHKYRTVYKQNAVCERTDRKFWKSVDVKDRRWQKKLSLTLGEYCHGSQNERIELT
jgi:hypothetical protein